MFEGSQALTNFTPDLQFLENKQLKFLKKTQSSTDIDILKTDLMRVEEFYHFQSIYYLPQVKGYHKEIDYKGAELLPTDYSYFNKCPEIPVHLYTGKFDTKTSRRGVAYVRNSIEHAKLYEYKGGYFEQPFSASIQRLIAENFQQENAEYNKKQQQNPNAM